MYSLNVVHLSNIRYEERLLDAQKRRSWHASQWFRKLSKLAQFAVMLFY